MGGFQVLAVAIRWNRPGGLEGGRSGRSFGFVLVMARKRWMDGGWRAGRERVVRMPRGRRRRERTSMVLTTKRWMAR